VSLSVTVSQSSATAREGAAGENYTAGGGGGELRHPRKRLADCLAVPAATGAVCPQDLTASPRPEASCPSGADSRDVVLTFVAPQAYTPTGAGVTPAIDSGLVTVPANLTVTFDVLSSAYADVATMYQYQNGTGARGGMLPTALEYQGAPVRVLDSLERLLVSPTPAASGAGGGYGSGSSSANEALPGSPSVALRYRACAAEDGTCAAAVGSAEVDVNQKPQATNTAHLIAKKKGEQSAGFRLSGSDSDSTELLYVITHLPSDILAKGSTKFCNSPNPPPSTTCAGVLLPSQGLGFCTQCTVGFVQVESSWPVA
jgi:hypothetical protein